MVMAQCLFKALGRRSPGCMLDVVGPPWAPALLERMPEVDHAIRADIAHGELGLRKRWRIGRQLRQNGYDQAFVTSRSVKSALIPWFARVPRRTGYRGESRYAIVNDMRVLNTTELKQNAQRYVALSLAPDEPAGAAADIEFPELTVDERNRARLVAEHGLSLQRPAVALVPGAAYGPSKRWPASCFARLARELADNGLDCWVFGSDGDAAIGREIASAAPAHCADLCGKTSLAEVIDLMSLARTAVSNDTGLMHIAAATVPSIVVLYGPTSPIYTPPLCRDPVILWLNRGCSLRNATVDELGYAHCLRDVPVADALRACINPDDPDIPSRYVPAQAPSRS